HEFGERKQVRQIDIADDLGVHQIGRQPIAERKREVVDEEEDHCRNDEVTLRRDQPPKLGRGRQYLPLGSPALGGIRRCLGIRSSPGPLTPIACFHWSSLTLNWAEFVPNSSFSSGK